MQRPSTLPPAIQAKVKAVYAIFFNPSLPTLEPTERIVYSAIVRAGTRGAWMRDLREGLTSPQLLRILSVLEKRQLVRSFKGAEGSKKFYILSDLQPNREASGGVWYAGAQFDAQMVDALRLHAIELISHSPQGITVAQLESSVKSTGVSRQELEQRDIQTILDVLVYDGIASAISVEQNGKETVRYMGRCGNRIGQCGTIISRIPCGTCPVRSSCGICSNSAVPIGQGRLPQSHSAVMPSNCPYWDDWINPPPQSAVEDRIP